MVLLVTRSIKQYLPILTILTLAFVIYNLGSSGSLYYDDLRPLQQLENIHDWRSAALYITSEISGPLGRPLSMITFALQQSSWPEQISNFLIFNIFLHLTNGVLVYLLCKALLTVLNTACSQAQQKMSNVRPELTTILVTALWLLSPIQISTTLITIQRMTGLSGFFMLSGFLLYVYGVQNAATKLRRSRLQQICGLGLMTLLAMFSKENGLLLPVLALVLEKTLLRDIKGPDTKLRLTFLWFSTTVVIGYLIYFILSTGGVYPYRDFTMLERVLTQPYILLTYLKLSFVPDLFAYNPFHDNIQVFSFANIPWYGLLAISIVLTLLSLAVAKKLRYPVLSFAILWFFSAHLLESTVLGLELYFEHRNYLAIFGPCFAIGWYLSQWSMIYPRLIITGTLSYLGLMTVITGFICSLWGNPLKAAETWFDKQFGSSRAAEHLATIYLRQGYAMQAYFTLQAQTKACDDCIGSHTQFMLVACLMDDPSSVKQSMKKIRELAHSQKIIGGASTTLGSLKKHIEKQECKHISMPELVSLNKLLLQYQTKEINANKRFELLLNLHQLAEYDKNTTESQKYLFEVYELLPQIKVGEVVFNNLMNSGNYAAAEHFLLNKLCNKPPRNWFARDHYQQRCELMQLELQTRHLGTDVR